MDAHGVYVGLKLRLLNVDGVFRLLFTDFRPKPAAAVWTRLAQASG